MAVLVARSRAGSWVGLGRAEPVGAGEVSIRTICLSRRLNVRANSGPAVAPVSRPTALARHHDHLIPTVIERKYSEPVILEKRSGLVVPAI